MQLHMRRPIARMVMSSMVGPAYGAEDHEFGVVVVVAVAEDLYRTVIALGDLLVEFLAEFADCCWLGI